MERSDVRQDRAQSGGVESVEARERNSAAGGLVRVVVVGGVRLYREGLALSLADRGGFEVVTSVAEPELAVEAVLEHRPDVVLMDISLPGAHSLVREVRTADLETRIVAFAVAETVDSVLACAEAGIAGYVPADGSVDDLTYTIRRAVRGEVRVPPRIAGAIFQRLAALAEPEAVADALECLTPRELQILELIAGGMANKPIARRLSIRVATVKNHVHNILDKLGVSTRGEAAARFHESRRMGLG